MSGFNLRLRTTGVVGSGGTGIGIGGGSGKVVPKAAFGMHIGNIPPTTIWGDYSQSANLAYHQVNIPSMGMGSIRLWDSNGCSWRNIERSRGNFTWDRLDYAVAQSVAAGLDIIINLGCGPDWATTSPGQMAGLYVGYNPFPPSDNTYWTEWCAAIGARYSGNNIKYEIWNEVNDQSSGAGVAGSGFVGSIATLVTLAQIAKSVISALDSTAKFLTPNFVGQDGITGSSLVTVCLDAYLAAGGAQYADIISVHGYNTCAPWPAPEGIITFGKRVKDTCSKYGVSLPVWNTEWGYGEWKDSTGAFRSIPAGSPYPDPMTPAMGANYITRMLALSWSSGFDRIYFYGLDAGASYATIVMVNPDSAIDAQTVLLPGTAYSYFSQQLVGGYLSTVENLADSNSLAYYKTSFTTGSEKVGCLLWTSDYSSATIPDLGIISASDNVGNPIPITGSLQLSGSPIFAYYT